MNCEQCHDWGVVIFSNEPPLWCRCPAGPLRQQQALERIAQERWLTESGVSPSWVRVVGAAFGFWSYPE